jgi:hypothetical protein
MPQPPQFRTSVFVLTHPPAHDIVPVVHADSHVPVEQTAVAPHFVPHVPQFAGSVTRFTHWPLHVTEPWGQLHLPFVHAWPPLHVTPQAPQFVRLEVRSTQAPPHEVRADAPPSAAVEHEPLHAPW